MEEINLKNTVVSFTPSFSGNGWETSLLPKLERSKSTEPEFRITFDWIRQLFLKMHLGGRKERTNEVKELACAL